MWSRNSRKRTSILKIGLLYVETDSGTGAEDVLARKRSGEIRALSTDVPEIYGSAPTSPHLQVTAQALWAIAAKTFVSFDESSAVVRGQWTILRTCMTKCEMSEDWHMKMQR